MEKQGYLYPPLSFDFDPDDDLIRFRKRMAVQAIRGKLKTCLPFDFNIKSAEELTDDQIVSEFERLERALERLHFSVDLREGILPRPKYQH